eukprot:1161618-Pelagomonas_calceolata.AAC.3
MLTYEFSVDGHHRFVHSPPAHTGPRRSPRRLCTGVTMLSPLRNAGCVCSCSSCALTSCRRPDHDDLLIHAFAQRAAQVLIQHAHAQRALCAHLCRGHTSACVMDRRLMQHPAHELKSTSFLPCLLGCNCTRLAAHTKAGSLAYQCRRPAYTTPPVAHVLLMQKDGGAPERKTSIKQMRISLTTMPRTCYPTSHGSVHTYECTLALAMSCSETCHGWSQLRHAQRITHTHTHTHTHNIMWHNTSAAVMTVTAYAA